MGDNNHEDGWGGAGLVELWSWGIELPGINALLRTIQLGCLGSGTGGAGLIGAGAYSLATTALGLSSKNTIFTSAFLPIVMLASFFVFLPRTPLARRVAREQAGSSSVDEDRGNLHPDAEDMGAAEEEGLLQKVELRGTANQWTEPHKAGLLHFSRTCGAHVPSSSPSMSLRPLLKISSLS